MSAAHKTSWIALLCVMVAVPTVVGTLPFGYQFMLSPFSSPAVLILGVGAAVSVIAWAVACLRGELGYRHHSLMPVVGIFALMAGLSTLFSLDRDYAFFGDGDDLNGLAVYVLCALLVPVTASLCSGSRRIRSLTTAVIASGVVVGAIALLQQLFGADIFREIAADQVAELGWLISQGASTLGNPDFTGTFLVAPAVLAIARAIASDTRDPAAAAVEIAPAAVISGALVLTLTRGAWLGLAAGVGVLLAITIVRSGKSAAHLRRVAIAGAITLAAVLALGGSEILRRFRELAEGGLAGLAGRTIIWSETLRMIAERPLLGTGPAAFRLGWYQAREVAGLIVSADAFATDAHNYPLMLAATMGIPAAVALLYVWIHALVDSRRLVWGGEAKGSIDYQGWWAASLALAVALLTGVATTPVVLLVFVGIGVLLSPLASPPASSPGRQAAISYPAAAIALAALVATGAQGWAHVAARSALNESPQALSQVAASVPWNGHLGLLAAQLEAAAAQQAFVTSEDGRDTLARVFGPPAERHPNDPEFAASWAVQLFIAGETLGDRDLFTEGLEVSERAVRLYPNSLRLRTDRARALIASGQPEKALEELQRFRELDASAPDVGVVRGLIDDAEAAASGETTTTP